MDPTDILNAAQMGMMMPEMQGMGAMGGRLPGSEALAQRFESMMSAPGGVNAIPGEGGTNVVADILNKQEKLMQGNEAEMMNLYSNANTMSLAELTIKGIEMSRSVAISNFRLQAATSIAQGSNKSLQTLLKNQ